MHGAAGRVALSDGVNWPLISEGSPGCSVGRLFV